MDKDMVRITRHAEVSEKSIERHLVERVRRAGGLCLKYSNPGMTGYPDRLVLLPGGTAFWVELKSKGRKPGRLQRLRHGELERLGFTVLVVDSREAVDGLFKAGEDGI